MAKFGLSSWGGSNAPKRNNNGERVRVPFLKTKNGNNILRIVTGPYIQQQAWVVNAQTGKKMPIRSAIENCPLREAGIEVDEKSLVGVLMRPGMNDPEGKSVLGILTLSPGLKRQIDDLVEEEGYEDITGYDINIKRKDGEQPANFYKVLPRPTQALSSDDEAILDEKREDLLNTLERITTPQSPDEVREQMIKAGLKASDGGSTEEEEKFVPPKTQEEDDIYNFEPA